jgi:hypothetical protein
MVPIPALVRLAVALPVDGDAFEGLSRHEGGPSAVCGYRRLMGGMVDHGVSPWVVVTVRGASLSGS